MNSDINVKASRNVGNIREGYIQVTGGKVWYKVVGNNNGNIPILVLHGGPGASYDYLEPLAELADERPVVFYDQLGCGNSDKPDDTPLWTIERFVDELHQVRKALGLKKVHIIGQSWGTSLAVDYLFTKQPEGVVSLVLSGPLLSTQRWIEDQKAYIAELPKEIREIILKSEDAGEFTSPQYQDAMMAYYKIHVCRLDPWPECLNRSFEKLNGSIYKYMWGPSEFTVTGVLKNYERVERLKEIAIPVLFTCGLYDEATPATCKYYQENLPGSEMHVFEDASHEHHLEKPQEYLQIVGDFLRRAEKGQNRMSRTSQGGRGT
ncbi:MAG TPA: proline iminopeptidase-family hydrolase [Geobacteraceae bacterium]|nr:proline iminopeptidase-family hydrolase [Geobacteraceae bacterium]